MNRYLALDVGSKTIGIAVSDLLNLTAQGLTTVKRQSNKNDLEILGKFIKDYEVDTLVIGLPKNMNGTEGESCDKVRAFAKKINAAYPNIKIQFWDERLSTSAAEKLLIAADVSRKKRKQVIDKMAAVNILEGFLATVTN